MSQQINSLGKWVLLLSFSLTQGLLLSQEMDPLKIMHYNLLRFGNECTPVTINQKADWLETVLAFYQPDIFTVNELAPEEAFENLIVQAAQFYNPAMEAAGFTNEAGSDIVNDLFYNGDKLGFKEVQVLPGAFRDINVYTLYEKDVSGLARGDTLFIECIVAHFKAGRDEEDRELRIGEAEEILDWLAAREGKGNILFMGDLNFDNAGEDGWKMLVDPDSSLSFIDPLNLIDDWNGPDFAAVHTQSTRTMLPDCGVNGGLDDRFDFILLGPQTESISYVPGSYAALGNSGDSFNEALGCDGGEVPVVVCNTLKQLSDHLPVVMEMELGELVSSQGFLGDHLLSFNNPITQTLYIRIEEELPGFPLNITLTSMRGKEVFYSTFSDNSQTIELGVESLPSGLYVLKISTESGRFLTGKVLKW